MASAYTKSTLFKSAQLEAVTANVLYKRFMPILVQQASSPDQLELLEFSYSLSLDLVNGFIFGIAGGSNFLNGIDGIGPWLVKYEQRYCHEGLWVQELPNVAYVLRRLGIEILPRSHFEGATYIENWVLRMCDRAEKTVLVRELEDGSVREGDIPAVYEQVRNATCKDSPQMSPSERRLEIATELFDHLCMSMNVRLLCASIPVPLTQSQPVHAKSWVLCSGTCSTILHIILMRNIDYVKSSYRVRI